MPWQQKIPYLMNQPIEVSFVDGTGTSGVLYGVSGGKLLVMEYLYHAQFALRQYDVFTVQDIYGYPGCPG
ncbi:hypothetical protein [Sutcliffiella horikoshii]|uniref:hypothetical protein n=1 Tax=Sutcliffiella horikoshii TaxID=79883 RepID=UPI003CF6EBE6